MDALWGNLCQYCFLQDRGHHLQSLSGLKATGITGMVAQCHYRHCEVEVLSGSGEAGMPRPSGAAEAGDFCRQNQLIQAGLP